MPETVVLKFGGTSVRDDSSMEAAVVHVRRSVEEGKRTVVVVSAMGREGEPYATDSLIKLMRSTGEPVSPRELDLAISTGEILSAAFFAHFLTMNEIPACAFTGQQAGFITDDAAGAAEILEVRPIKVQEALDSGLVTVVAGFQGADEAGTTRTLGRGGSDTSAVALGAALDAAEVEIYSDVDGVALCDPRRIPEAPFLTEIGANQLLAMAEEGSVILHPRAVRVAQEKKMSVRIRNTFTQMPGTVIHHRPTITNPNPISLAHQGKQILVHTVKEQNSAKELPELLDTGNGQFLLLDDVYADIRLKQLGEKYGDISEERGWGTVSVIFAGKSEENAPELPDAEKVRSPSDRWRYLLREEQITPTLNTLFKLFFT